MPYPHPYITLTAVERERLKQELKRLALLQQWKKRKPLQALYLSDQKKIFQDIANYLSVSYRTVRGWIYQYKKGGLDSFIPLSDKG